MDLTVFFIYSFLIYWYCCQYLIFDFGFRIFDMRSMLRVPSVCPSGKGRIVRDTVLPKGDKKGLPAAEVCDGDGSGSTKFQRIKMPLSAIPSGKNREGDMRFK
jgi:hypothetical protein